jgi:acetyl-CoA C-acetyltransferase
VPDPAHTPVLVGVSQILQRTDDLAAAREPLELMIEAALEAAKDAGSRELLRAAGAVRVIRGMWRYADPARAVAERIGCPGAETAITPFGGNCVQSTVNRSCLDIQSGAHDVVVLAGAECGRSWARARKSGVDLGWSDAPGTPDLVIGEDMAIWHDAIIEIALRHARGESVAAHLARVSELWAGFSEVAARNPSAWIREARTAAEIATPGPSNPPVSFPYPMMMNSNSRVDMGAALILCSEATAKRLGVPREKWVYPHTGTDAHDHCFVSERADLCSSPAMRIAGGRALELAGVEPAQLDHVDIYSCFPSAVQVAAKEIGLDSSRPLTVTGGLTFGGGPMNNYVMHGVARMVEVLRDEPGARGMCTGNGGFITKHAFGVYSTEPPSTPFQYADLKAEVDAKPEREALVDHAGEVEIESYTVMYEDGAPSVAHAACLLPDGRRTWGNVSDLDVARAMTREEFCGRGGRIDGAGCLTVEGS